MSTPADNLPGQQSATPPPPLPSTTGAAGEKTVTPPAQTKPPDTLAPDLDADEKEYQTKHGEGWAIKAYREEKTKSAKYKDIREVADRIGNPEIVKAGLQAIDALADPTVPIGEAKAELLAFDEDRYHELRNDFYGEFVDKYPDQVASDILGEKTTVAAVKAAMAATKGGTSRASASTKAAGAFKVPDDLKEDYPEVAEMLEKLQAQLAEASPGDKPDEAATKGKADELQKQLDKLNTDRQREEYLAEVQTQGAQLYDDVFSEVDAVMQDLGLAPDKDDPEDLASLKEAARDYLGDRNRVEAKFDASEENVKLANRITEHLARRQFKRAKEYLPSAKIATRAAVEALAEDRKGKALVDAVKRELQALAQSGTKRPGGKAPLIGGTPSGAQPPTFKHGKGDDALWDEMEQQVRARQASQR